MKRLAGWWTRFIDWLEPAIGLVPSYDCDHFGQVSVSHFDRKVGWTGVCEDCGAFFLDMDVLRSTR
jgi:hypothetical protein